MSISGKPEVEDRSVGYYACRFPAPDRTDSVRQRVLPGGIVTPSEHWGQVLGRGLVPRLSIGTLQLSIPAVRPSTSLPKPLLSGQRPRRIRSKLAAFDVGRSSCLSKADAGNASQIANNETNDGLNNGGMHGPVNL